MLRKSDKGMKVSDYGWKDNKPNLANQYLSPVIIDYLQKLQLNNIVDLGCGNGALCKNLYDSGFNVCGIDSDANAIEIAKSAYPGIKFFNKSVYDEVDYINEKTNIVVSTEVIEHLYDPSELFHYADTVLSEDGVLILSTVYHGYFKNLIISLLNKWDKHWLPEWEGGHIKFWSKKSLTIFAQEHNYKLVFFRGVGRLPFLWKSMILVFVKSN